MIKREAFNILKTLEKGYPVISITGPRQSGKTTLAKLAFSNKEYVSLETPTNLDFAINDPTSFLKKYQKGAIIDEAQKAPLLFSYLQEIVDKSKIMGQFILTGSQQFGLLSKITQSLAGRVGNLELLPLSILELDTLCSDIYQQIFTGFYPSIYDRELNPTIWYEDYVKTYLERDVKELINIKDLRTFRNFLKLCAVRNGQILNITELCNDANINRKTANSWLSVLEQSYIIHFLHPYTKSFSKRIVKSPKLYFYDSGLVSYLLGIRSSKDIFLSPFKGALFESMIISEMKKFNMNHRKAIDFYFWRDNKGIEIDVIFETAQKINSIEIKSSSTIQNDFFKNLKSYQSYVGKEHGNSFLIYGGDQIQDRKIAKAIPWIKISEIF